DGASPVPLDGAGFSHGRRRRAVGGVSLAARRTVLVARRHRAYGPAWSAIPPSALSDGAVDRTSRNVTASKPTRRARARSTTSSRAAADACTPRRRNSPPVDGQMGHGKDEPVFPCPFAIAPQAGLLLGPALMGDALRQSPPSSFWKEGQT